MQLLKEIRALLAKDLLLEWRQRYALNGILLYVVSTVVLIYLAFIEIDDVSWITLFWILLLFASVNAVAKSFRQESAARQRYYYTLAHPQAIILAKILYNILLLIILASLALGVYTLLLGNPVAEFDSFVLIVLLGSCSFALCFTLISAIAAKASTNATLMPILSFPVVIPILALLITTSKAAMLGLDDENFMKDIQILLAIDGILMVLSLVLFPFLWRD